MVLCIDKMSEQLHKLKASIVIQGTFDFQLKQTSKSKLRNFGQSSPSYFFKVHLKCSFSDFEIQWKCKF